jgi:hypothetical protein
MFESVDERWFTRTPNPPAIEYLSGPSKERMTNSVFSGVKCGSVGKGTFPCTDSVVLAPLSFIRRGEGMSREITTYGGQEIDSLKILCFFAVNFSCSTFLVLL